jgi:hypothetical protein
MIQLVDFQQVSKHCEISIFSVRDGSCREAGAKHRPKGAANSPTAAFMRRTRPKQSLEKVAILSEL